MEVQQAQQDHQVQTNQIEQLNAEKVALDQMLVTNLRECLAAKKDLLIKSAHLELAKQEIESLKNQVAGLWNELNNIKVEVEPEGPILT